MTVPTASAAERRPGAAGDELNLKQAARRLGVHYMTAYRYVRQGRLAAERCGTTWQVSPAAVEQLLAERAATGPWSQLGPSPGRRPGRGVDWAGRLTPCLLAGDEAASWRVVQAALAAGHPATFCYVDMLSTALANIGARWDAGEISVADQYVATAVATRIVARLGAASRRPGRRRGGVVFGAPLGEHHGLPVSIAADLVRLAGFSVLELGANVPPAAFAAAARRTPRLVAVGIGITVSGSIGAAQDAIDAVRDVDVEVPVIIGGQAAFTAAGSRLMGVNAWVADGRAAAATIEALASSRRRTGRAESDGPPDQGRGKADAGPALTGTW
jgi:MerR family transcriptional regulator, light-induced transcriptional regulator